MDMLEMKAKPKPGKKSGDKGQIPDPRSVECPVGPKPGEPHIPGPSGLY